MIHIIGAGLAGCEAAWQIVKKNTDVNLYEMKPERYSPAHVNPGFAELVCSNSLKADNIETASGLLKQEMRIYDSLILSVADKVRVPAGGALAVDREAFSKDITEAIHSNEYIHVIEGEVCSIEEITSDPDDIVIIATGPLTSDSLAESISKYCGKESLSFFDAAAPVIYGESINMDIAFRADRYDKGNGDYINCPMTKEEYLAFYNELMNSEKADVKGFDDISLYEGCMPVESMGSRGIDTLRFGPLKPVGIKNPHTGKEYYAVVQLRQDDKDGKLYNMVGFQTRLKFPEQKRVFSMIPGLENAEFARYGVMHRNTYIRSPGFLDSNYRVINSSGPVIYFAGQITGVEGYIESASSGLVAGVSAVREARGKEKIDFTRETAIGALAHYAAEYPGKDYQPMGINFGIIDSTGANIDPKIKNKQLKRKAISEYVLHVAESISLKVKEIEDYE